MEVSARYPKEFAARRNVQQYQLPRSVHQQYNQSHKLSGSQLSSLQVIPPSANLQQVTPIVKAGIRHTVCQRCTHVLTGLLTRHAPCHAALLQHRDADADFAGSNTGKAEWNGVKFQARSRAADRPTLRGGCFKILVCDFGTVPLLPQDFSSSYSAWLTSHQ